MQNSTEACLLMRWDESVKMQLRPMLVVCVAIASGLLSGVHLYLVSSRGHKYISVALEIPVERVQGSTNVQLNIHSVGNSDSWREDGEETNNESETPHQSSNTETSVQIPFDHYWGKGEGVWGEVGEDEDEEDVIFDDDEEEYEVLLDTGEYELEEKDMDKIEVEREPSPPPLTQRHTKKKRREHYMMKSSVAGTYSSHMAETQEQIGVHEEPVTDGASEAGGGQAEKGTTEDFLVRKVEGKQVKGPFAISKEEYYARQTTLTRPPPVTHSPHHHTHKNHTHTSSQCSQPPCLQFLSAEERFILSKCQKKTVPKSSHRSIPACKCKFRSGVGKKRVALVSLPGSGNTWVRGLLEKASGLCTGSIYCDRTLREGGFCGEGLQGSSLVAIKTHDSSLQWRGGKKTDSTRPVFDKAILIIRNPFKANIAEWNRLVSKKYASDQTGSSHVKYVANEAFFGDQGGWQAQVRYLTHKWRLILGNNLRAQAAGRPVLPVFFEDIKTDPTPQLSRMMEFLELPVTPAIINATAMDGFTSYYRNHTDHFDHYTAEQRMFVNNIISSTADALHDMADDIAKTLREYIHH